MNYTVPATEENVSTDGKKNKQPAIGNIPSSGGFRGGPSLIFRPNGGPKGRKNGFFETGPPLSEGLAPPLHLMNRHLFATDEPKIIFDEVQNEDILHDFV